MRQEQLLIRKLCGLWETSGGWVAPSLADALDFLVTEVAEAVDARLRMTPYIRNNPKATTSLEIGEELADVLLMTLVSLDIIGVDAQACLARKLQDMDTHRGSPGKDVLHDYLYRVTSK